MIPVGFLARVPSGSTSPEFMLLQNESAHTLPTYHNCRPVPNNDVAEPSSLPAGRVGRDTGQNWPS